MTDPMKWRDIRKCSQKEEITKRITMDELEEALYKANPYTSPGESGIPTEIWKNINNSAKEEIL